MDRWIQYILVPERLGPKDYVLGASSSRLVLQGWGSVGAYEAGVFNALYYWIKKD